MTSGEVVTIDPRAPDQQTIKRVTDLIMNNGVVVVPTETRYGLLVRADRADNVKRIYDIKKRDLNLPTAVFVGHTGDLKEHLRMNQLSILLAQKFLPGPLTLVGESISSLESPIVINGKIGLRVSSSLLMAALTKAVPFPLTSTSANRSGQLEAVTCGEIVESLGNEVDLYLDAGPLEGPVSTVIDTSSQPPKILREGAISSEEISAIVGSVR